jgi:hypothetical protein
MDMVRTALRGAALLLRAAYIRLSADQSIRHSLRHHAHSQNCVEAWRCPRILIEFRLTTAEHDQLVC